ncbi:hypothetical protein B0H11DRAFT_1922352 [Mycena galericulata]|nr:hypothetical protein B0H11DRAFT_1922352 [Mycena galericulata]
MKISKWMVLGKTWTYPAKIERTPPAAQKEADSTYPTRDRMQTSRIDKASRLASQSLPTNYRAQKTPSGARKSGPTRERGVSTNVGVYVNVPRTKQNGDHRIDMATSSGDDDEFPEEIVIYVNVPRTRQNADLPYRQGNVVWRAKAGRLIVAYPKRRQEHERSGLADASLIKSKNGSMNKVDASWKDANVPREKKDAHLPRRATPKEANPNGDLPYRQGNVVWRAKAGRIIDVHTKRRQEHERWSDSVDPSLIKSTSSRETSPRMSRPEGGEEFPQLSVVQAGP